MTPGRLQPLVWPGALLAVGAGLMLASEGLAHIDGFRAYGAVGGIGCIVAVIGGVWLIGVLIGLVRDRARRRR